MNNTEQPFAKVQIIFEIDGTKYTYEIPKARVEDFGIEPLYDEEYLFYLDPRVVPRSHTYKVNLELVAFPDGKDDLNYVCVTTKKEVQSDNNST